MGGANDAGDDFDPAWICRHRWGPEQAEDFAAANLEVDAAEGGNVPGVVFFDLVEVEGEHFFTVSERSRDGAPIVSTGLGPGSVSSCLNICWR